MNSYFNSAVNVDGANFPPISTSWSNEQNTVGLGDDKGVNSEQTYDLIFDVSTEAFYKKNEVLDLGPENTTSLSSKVLEPSHQVVLTSKTFTECLNSSHYLTFSTQNVVTNIKTKASDKLPRLSSCKIQVTAPASTIFYINVISINVQCTSFQLVLTDVGATSRRLINSCDNDIPSELWSFTNVVVMTFLVSLESQVIQVALNFTAVPATQRPQLEILFTSSTRGYIQTPSWDGHKRYPVLMDSWVKVDVPEQSAIMVSLPHIDIEGDSPFYCPGDGVELYVIETLNQSSWTRCKSKLVPPTLYQTRALLVHFYSNEYGSNTGFRLLFSIHNQSSLPVELADGRWNCSGLNWTDFSSHFSCNLRSDCVGSEDEAICPYTSDRCGVGQPFFENSCYIWQKPSPVMTWKEAFDFCLSRGARLASLNTPAEWNNAISLMSLADYTVVFVGMLQMFLQRQMYLNAFQWTDGTIAYFKTINGYATMPACGFFVFDALLLGIKLKDCSEPRQAHVLCETEAHPGTHLPSEHKNDKLMITQCISESERCDGIEQCVNGVDEAKCLQRGFTTEGILPPAIVDLDNLGQLVVKPLDSPESTFSMHNVVVDIRTKASDKLPRLSSCEIQVTAPTSMVFFINIISINVKCDSFQLVLADVGATSRRLINSCDNDIPRKLWSFTNVVVMTFVVMLESQKPSPEMSWKEAFDFCLSRGTRLASLNTPAEWNNAISLMSLDDYWVAYVGLLQMFLQRQMYLNAWQWIDGTIAYSIATNGIATMPACGQFYMTSMMQGVKLKECYVRRPAHVLCEMEAESGSQLRPEKDKPHITFLEASAWANDSKVMCPEGHVTHNFLSCDLPSSCWQQTSSSLLAGQGPVDISPMGQSSRDIDQRPNECISESERCDGIEQCVTGVDEAKCLQRTLAAKGILPPAIVDLDKFGQLVVKPLESQLSSPQSTACPDTHFECPAKVTEMESEDSRSGGSKSVGSTPFKKVDDEVSNTTRPSDGRTSDLPFHCSRHVLV
ncbi:hypothetical protein C0Q70_10548 [Pomacea canaliculata]|uniref:C-type lectin domain-containing protein n=1 Tax=Pomacea canaliculata TaxID=400727 RepID=A0A2T7P3G7_POMCA|nr:hypothetical protein C0Q70_10548 [Pomacea canaliculata]